MSQLDDLLARSRSPGRLVERRAFTLSREKAIEKQREFALRHPQQYVLELVQGAVFGGATYLAVDTRPSAMLVAWVGGRPLEGPELENLFDWLFADRGDRRWRHLVQLAIGVNALLQRRPRALRIESGDGTRAVRLDLDARGGATLGVPSEPIAGTYLYAEHEAGWFARFAGSGSSTAEQALVEERCLYTPVPILLNGTAPFGYRGSRHIEIFGARAQEYFDEEGRRGVVAVHASERAPVGFRMVVGGVWISTLPLEPLADRRLVGVVCDDALRKTADQSDVVQDHRYVEMLHAVQPVATRLLRRVEGAGYRPPPLPPIPRAPEEAPGDRPQPDLVAPEPLPEPLPAAGARRPRALDEVRAAGGPVFRVAPEHLAKLGGAVEPHAFPWLVLMLSDGESKTLEAEAPGLAVHRLTSRADVDFVRRIVERGARVREHVVAEGGRELVLRLHVEGPMPDWAEGRPGLPYCVVGGEETVELGAADLDLPRVSVRVTAGGWDEVAAELVRKHCVALDPHPELLAALLAAHAVPQLALADGQPRLGISLPVGWPESMLAAPLARTTTGTVSLADLVALEGTDRAVEIPDAAELRALDRLEERLGYGHLANAALAGRPLYGAGRVGDRWVWLDDPATWANPALQQIVWVASTFAPRDHDERWQTGPRPAPGLVGAFRAGVELAHWSGGWRALFEGLQRVEADRSWPSGRAEGLGRLALVRLAVLLGLDDVPLLVPSDGGGRRSLAEIRTHRAARVVARRGVRLAEPWTFALTRDELAAIEVDGRPRLRYDDDAEVWRALPESERGWLVSQEVRGGGLRGWLGLRVPHDPTTGVLWRSTGELVGLSDLERSVPCHGLLWPQDGGSDIGAEQRRLAQLAGLRLYQELASVLGSERDPERLDAARRYATTFVLLSHRRAGKLLGTALELARRVEVADPAGGTWGTLERWLEAPAEARPALPEELLPEEEASAVVEEAPPDDPLGARLRDALGAPAFGVGLGVVEGRPHGDPIVLDAARSHRGRVVLTLNGAHPLIRKALDGPGAAREVVLVELARKVCAWGAGTGVSLDLTRAQQVLLAQRF